MVGVEPGDDVVVGEFLAAAGFLILPLLGAGDLRAGRLTGRGPEIVVVVVHPPAHGAAEEILDREILVGELHVVAAVVAAAEINQARRIFRRAPGGVGGLVGLVAHAPDDDARMVAVAPDHFLHVLLLNVAAEGDVLDVGRFLDEEKTEAVALVVNERIVWIVGGALEKEAHVETDVLEVLPVHPFRHRVAEPRKFLVPVRAAQHEFFAV